MKLSFFPLQLFVYVLFSFFYLVSKIFLVDKSEFIKACLKWTFFLGFFFCLIFTSQFSFKILYYWVYILLFITSNYINSIWIWVCKISNIMKAYRVKDYFSSSFSSPFPESSLNSLGYLFISVHQHLYMCTYTYFGIFSFFLTKNGIMLLIFFWSFHFFHLMSWIGVLLRFTPILFNDDFNIYHI